MDSPNKNHISEGCVTKFQKVWYSCYALGVCIFRRKKLTYQFLIQAKLHIVLNYLRKFISQLEVNIENYILLQDGASCHTSKSTQRCLNVKQLDALTWPAQSPDVNGIENGWEMMAKKTQPEKIKSQDSFLILSRSCGIIFPKRSLTTWFPLQ